VNPNEVQELKREVQYLQERVEYLIVRISELEERLQEQQKGQEHHANERSTGAGGTDESGK
jgi:prefoldin subunit 5